MNMLEKLERFLRETPSEEIIQSWEEIRKDESEEFLIEDILSRWSENTHLDKVPVHEENLAELLQYKKAPKFSELCF